MFTGTVRYNLDPLDKHDERDLWYSLELCNLKEFILTLPSKLDEKITEGGSNFLVSQRQLLCMARAILQKPKILVLDENTMGTDIHIQRIIRTHFRYTTLLVIAQRLNTVMDLDRIMVIDKGRVAEFNTPKILSNNKSSVLFGMIMAMGPTTAEHLFKIANNTTTSSNYTDEIKN